ncbi:MAG: YdcF family protein [Alphaproteobacteria bacterium]|nr:YdcF family protein [Alphaproteobacteria bacterium]
MRYIKYFFQFILLLGFFWICGYLIFLTLIENHDEIQQTEKADAIIVLTGGQNRIERGLELLSSGIANELFITGVNQAVTKEDILALAPIPENVPDCCITLGYKAETTVENALESKEWLNGKPEIKTVELITSDYHIYRAAVEFRAIIENVNFRLHPVPDMSTQKNAEHYFRTTSNEYNKFLVRVLDVIHDKIIKSVSSSDYLKE